MYLFYDYFFTRATSSTCFPYDTPLQNENCIFKKYEPTRSLACVRTPTQYSELCSTQLSRQSPPIFNSYTSPFISPTSGTSSGTKLSSYRNRREGYKEVLYSKRLDKTEERWRQKLTKGKFKQLDF